MLLTSPSIPSIRITPAPQIKVYPEPYSPIPSSKSDADNDAYRAKWLSVPSQAIALPRRSSPLYPTDSQKGLGRDQFDSLLSLSRDHRARLGKQMMPDLRKELVLKNQRLKQLERRAIFLSKIKEFSLAAVCEAPLKSPITAHCPISPRTFEPEVVAEDSGDAALVFSLNPGSNEPAEPGLTFTRQHFTNLKSPLALATRSRRAPPSLDV